jgi:hypothetical protein
VLQNTTDFSDAERRLPMLRSTTSRSNPLISIHLSTMSATHFIIGRFGIANAL